MKPGWPARYVGGDESHGKGSFGWVAVSPYNNTLYDPTPSSRALGVVLDVATAGLSMFRARHVPQQYQPVARVGFALATGVVGVGVLLNDRELARMSPAVVAGLGVGAAGLMYATWSLNNKWDNWLDRALEKMGVPVPEVVVGLACFVALRSQEAIERRVARKKFEKLMSESQGEPVERVFDMPAALADLLTGFADPALNPCPGAADALVSQVKVASLCSWDESVDELLDLGDVQANLTVTGRAQFDGAGPEELTGLPQGVERMRPAEHTYPVYARLEKEEAVHALRIVVHAGLIQSLHCEREVAPGVTSDFVPEPTGEGDEYSCNTPGCCAEGASLREFMDAFRAGRVQFVSEFAD